MRTGVACKAGIRAALSFCAAFGAIGAGTASAQTIVAVTPVQTTYGPLIQHLGTQPQLSGEAEELLGKFVLAGDDPDQYRAIVEGLSPDARALMAQYNDVFASIMATMDAAREGRRAVLDAATKKRSEYRNATDSTRMLALAPASAGPRLTIDGGYFDDDLVTLAGGGASHRGTSDGFYVNGRLTVDLDALTQLGAGVTYSRVDSRSLFGRQTARGEFILGSIHGSTQTIDGTAFDVLVTAGVLNARTRRDVSILGTPYTLVSDSHPTVLGAELGVSHGIFARDFVALPRLSLRGTHIVFGPVEETGGAPALRYDRHVANSLTARAGVTLSGTSALRPWFSGSYVHEFIDRPDSFGANFVVGSGPSGQFLLTGRDRDWGELGGGVTYGTDGVAVSLGAETQVARSDVGGTTYHGSIALRF